MKAPIFAVIPLFAAAVFAQPGAQPAAQEASNKARLEGIVLSTAGAPVPRADVSLDGPGTIQGGVAIPSIHYGVLSSEEGRFVIDGIEPGARYELTSRKTGYADGRYGAKTNAAASVAGVIALSPGQSLTGVVLSMAQQAVVTGRITDRNKEPAVGVQVVLARRVYQRGEWQVAAVTRTMTNDRGEYRFPNVLPGRYTVAAHDTRNPGQVTPRPKELSAPTFYPSVTDAAAAAYFTVSDGQIAEAMDVQLKESEVFRVQGTLAGDAKSTGSVVLIATLSGQGRNNNVVIQPPVLREFGMVQSQAREGVFEFPYLRPGQYLVQAVSAGPGGTRPLGKATLTVGDRDIDDWVFALSAPIGVPGKVTLEGDLDGSGLRKLLGSVDADRAKANASATVAATFNESTPSGQRMAIGVSETIPVPFNIRPAAGVLDDGTFLFEDLVPGHYMVTAASLPPTAYVKSIQAGGVDITRREADLTSGSRIDIVLSDRAARADMTVVDETGKSPSGVVLNLWPEEEDLNLINQGTRALTQDKNGQYHAVSLRPGVYYAVVFEAAEWGLARDRTYLNSLIPYATRITLAAGDQVTKEVKMLPASTSRAMAEKLQ
jgi:protocatechuate 3,4-dioxygenase beta subunit